MDMHLTPKSTPYLCHLLSIYATNMSQSGYNLACGNCNNWAYSCICRVQGEALYMAPISYYHPPSSDHDDNNFSHLTPTSGSNSSYSIPLAQGHSNHSQIINTTHPVVNQLASNHLQAPKSAKLVPRTHHHPNNNKLAKRTPPQILQLQLQGHL